MNRSLVVGPENDVVAPDERPPGRLPPPVVGDAPPHSGPRVLIASAAAVAVGAVLGIVGIDGTDLGDVDGTGLFAAMSPLFYIGVVIVMVGFVVASLRNRIATAWLHIVAMIGLLHGLPGILEPHPRFTVAWLHVGFADQIADDGTLLPFVDARFSWPGFFSAGGFLQRLSGTDSLLWLVRFAPVAINLVAAILVWNLALALRSTTRQAVFAAGFFVAANWIGQDYFAPQALGFIVSTFVITVVLRVFSTSLPESGWRARLLKPPSVTWPHRTGRRAQLVYAGLIVTILALVVTHQLSPVFLGSTLVALAVVGRIRPKMLGPFVFVAMASWLAFGAEAYWLGHLDKLFGSAGQPEDVLAEGLSRRATGSSEEREIVLLARLAFSGAIWGVTASILAIQRFRRQLDPAHLALLAGPFAAVVVQPYGGELLLRVALFTMPICAVVIAQTVVRSRKRWVVVPIAIAMVATIPLFMLARYGNEAYELTASDDLAVTEDLYRLAPDDSVVFVQNRQTLVSLDRIAEVRFRSLDRGVSVDEAISQLRGVAADREGSVYVLLTDSQAIYGTETQGLGADWILEFADEMLEDPAVSLVSRRGDSVLLSVEADEVIE